ncbi:hypothetical protein OPV22_015903 [Ensete ventricosum]|uniref:Transmembrane protein n=1 Tax=Ensete ventricosum TaxID=4639 RepID=A0AAV8R156_ENSVE|nr:hypothetical protein OPV22_015903 [Ensete ventricosum]
MLRPREEEKEALDDRCVGASFVLASHLFLVAVFGKMRKQWPVVRTVRRCDPEVVFPPINTWDSVSVSPALAVRQNPHRRRCFYSAFSDGEKDNWGFFYGDIVF